MVFFGFVYFYNLLDLLPRLTEKLAKGLRVPFFQSLIWWIKQLSVKFQEVKGYLYFPWGISILQTFLSAFFNIYRKSGWMQGAFGMVGHIVEKIIQEFLVTSWSTRKTCVWGASYTILKRLNLFLPGAAKGSLFFASIAQMALLLRDSLKTLKALVIALQVIFCFLLFATNLQWLSMFCKLYKKLDFHEP